jgi:hypothetical protein
LKRKLLLLNLALLALSALAALRLRDQRQEAAAREMAVRQQTVKPAPPPPVAPVAPPPKVAPADYIDIAQKMLFAKDRNPVVVLDAPPPPPAKKMPELPLFHGVMNLGDGPLALMSAKAGEPQVDVRFGGTVGDFKLVGIEGDDVVLEWEGQTVRKTRRELTKVETAAQAGAPPPRASAAPTATNLTQPLGPGQDLGGGTRACVAGDANPPGTVVDGLRKTVRNTMFGPDCRWEPVK